MKVTSAHLWIAILVLSVVLLPGRSRKVDKSLMVSENCSPPCVWNILPGVTETTKAIQLLESLEANNVGELTILDSGIIRWRASEANYYFYPDGDLINLISLSLESTTLEDIVGLFGEPASLDLGKIRDGYFFVALFYPERGLCFVVSGKHTDIDGFMIESSMPVVKADFLVPSDITTMVKSLYGKEIVEETLIEIQAWSGYGKLSP
jgi:hypothetical protein